MNKRNIVICSDGTGNTGRGADGTNVWRIRLAVACGELDGKNRGTEQHVIYHDGVGTEAFTAAKVLGLLFSNGLTRDLEYLYERLMVQYQEGDNLYLFGFSRGAYTIRLFAHMLNECGLAKTANGEGRYSLNRIRKIAADAVAAYKMRHANGHIAFRKEHNCKNAPTITFIGVWDTVSAVGLPFHNFTQALMQFWRRVTASGVPFAKYFKFALLNLHRPTNQFWTDWEDDDLHKNIENAYQALSIDDERDTFYPLLWRELVVFDRPPTNGRPPMNVKARRVKTALPIERFDELKAGRKSDNLYQCLRNVEQVWFAGMHADVGGGYDKDQLALVSLRWMMKHAENCGLVFKEQVRDRYFADADPLGLMHDSRSGFGMFYRYNPREISWFAENVGIAKPKIHQSVFDRIENSSQIYSPKHLPDLEEIEIVKDPIEDSSKRSVSL